MPRRKGEITNIKQTEKIYFPTGISILDFVVSTNTEAPRRGFPSGTSLEVYAPPSRGKSVLAAVIGRNAQYLLPNSHIIYINAEAESLHDSFIDNVLQIDRSRFHTIDSPILGDITKGIRKLLVGESLQDEPTVIVWDSLTEIKNVDSWDDVFDLSDSSLSAHIKKKMQFISNLLSISSIKPIFHVFVNQVRSNFKNTRFGHQKEYKTLDSPGGWELKHLVPYRIFIGTDSIKDKDIPIIGDQDISHSGFVGKFVLIKHRFYGQWQYFEIPFFFDFRTGSYDSMFTTFRMIEKYPTKFTPVIRKEGRKYILYTGNEFFYKDLIAYFKEDDEAYEQFEQQILNIFYSIASNPENVLNLVNYENTEEVNYFG